MRIKQSVCLPMMMPKETPLDAFLTEVSGMGFPAVEIWQREDDFDAIVECAHAHHLEVVSMVGHQSIARGLNDAGQHARIEDELRESIAIAARHHIGGLICFSGNVREDQSDENARHTVAEGLRRIAPFAEENGINLNLELLNSKIDHTGYQCDRTTWGVSVCKLVNSPRVKLLYDIYHMQIMEGDIIRTITENIQWIGHFHTAGVPGRFDIDETQELNYAAICSAIAATGYADYVGHEFQPRNASVFSSLKRAFEICDQR